MSKGKSQEQAAAIAYEEAKKRGYSDILHTSQIFEYSVSLDAVQKLNGQLVVPVTLAAEMVQDYHISEVPWLKDKLPKEVEYVKVFKPYEELKKAVQDLDERGITKIPYVMPHSEGTFLQDQCPTRLQKYIDMGYKIPFVKDGEVVAWVQEFKADDAARKIKGKLYLKTSYQDEQYQMFLNDVENGRVINVSIGFICDWAGAGEFKGQGYTLTQKNMQFGHLAGLVNARGKCPAGICGINQDNHIDTNHELSHITNICSNYYTFTSDVEIPTEHGCDCMKKKTPSTDVEESVSNGGFKSESESYENQEVTSMTPEEEAKKKAEEEKMKKESKDAAIDILTKANETLTQNVSDISLKLSLAEKTIVSKDAELMKVNEKLKKYEDADRKKFIEQLGADNEFEGKKVSDMCLHDLSLLASYDIHLKDKQLEKEGLPMPNQDQFNAKRSPSGSNQLLGISAGIAYEKGEGK